MKRSIACLVAMLLLLTAMLSVSAENTPAPAEGANTATPADTETAEEEEDPPLAPAFELVAQSGDLALWADLTGEETLGIFKVVNTATGDEWISQPLDAESDTIAKGKSKMELLSHIVVNHGNPTTKKMDKVPSRTGSVNKDGASAEKTENGFTLTFDFPDDGFTVPLAVKLEEGGLKVAVDFGQVKEYGENLIYSVQVLPYFAAVRENAQEGYLFLPDGSGALMYYGNGKTDVSAYSASVYGQDLNVTVQQLQEQKQAVRLPVFGAKTDDHAYLAIIEQGDALASVGASVAGDSTCYNRAYASFTVRTTDLYRFGSDASSLSQSTSVYSTVPLNGRVAAIRYCFLTGEQADYAGMAAAYRAYLIDAGVLGGKALDDLPFYMELLGGVVKQGTFLGFPVNKVTPMTDFNTAADLLELMNGKGVSSLVVKYNNWNSDVTWQRVVNDSGALSKLGGNRGLKSLLSAAAQWNARIYPDIDFTSVSRFSFFDGAAAAAAKTISDTDATTAVFRIDTFYKDTRFAKQYLLSLNRRDKAAADFAGSYQSRFGNPYLSVGQLGSVLYSDYTVETENRQTAADRTAALVAKLGKDNDLLVSGGNAYLLSAATHLLDLEESSRHDLMDVSVPFYAMVVHGYRYYAGEAWNLSANNRATFLRAMESGAAPHYYWCGASTAELVGTPYAGLYSGDAAYWADTAAGQYAALSELHRLVRGQVIVSHEILENGVTVTGYENGVTVLVNYAEEAAETLWGTVEAENYRIIEGEG